jgi:hypothetical protein
MDDVIAGLRRVRQELGGGAPASGLVSVPDDIQAQLREALAESPPITLMPKEQTSPSQTAPPLKSPPDSQPSWSPSLPSVPSPAAAVVVSASPSISQTPSSLAALAQSGEWRIGDVVVGEASRSRSSIGPRRPEPRTGAAIVAGVVVGLLAVGVGLAWRLGHLDPLLVALDPPPSPPPPSGPTATAAVSARLRIKTTPAGADVLDVSAGVPRLLGITPLVVPWEVVPGDGARTLQLRLPGHVPAVARVEPPAPSASGEPVHVDVEAALRPLPTTPPARR